MSHTTALIVHELMESPGKFVDKGNGTISNGYYMVSFDGSRFGMGVASYQSDGMQREILSKAIQSWKDDTGWSPPQAEIEEDHQPIGRKIVTPDVFLRDAYEAFSKNIRNHHRSFTVHKDATVLSTGIQNAIMVLDARLKPVEAIEGKRIAGQTDNISGS